jgi:hypothetical protein
MGEQYQQRLLQLIGANEHTIGNGTGVPKCRRQRHRHQVIIREQSPQEFIHEDKGKDEEQQIQQASPLDDLTDVADGDAGAPDSQAGIEEIGVGTVVVIQTELFQVSDNAGDRRPVAKAQLLQLLSGVYFFLVVGVIIPPTMVVAAGNYY